MRGTTFAWRMIAIGLVVAAVQSLLLFPWQAWALGAFNAAVLFPLTVNGQPNSFAGTLTFSPLGTEVNRTVTGTGKLQSPVTGPAAPFSAAVSFPVPVSGRVYRFSGTLLFTPAGASANRKVTGSGTLLPAVTTPPLALSYLSMAPGSVTAGQGAVVTVVLNRSPGEAVQIPLVASAPNIAGVAPSLTILPGQTGGTAAVTTYAVVTAQMVTVIATLNGQSKSANLTVNPLPLPPPPLSAFEFVGANPVTGPGGTTVRATLSAPAAADTPVAVTADNALARVNPLVVRAGQAQGTASVYVGTPPPGSTTTVTIAATLQGVTKTLALVVLSATVSTLGPVIEGYTRLGGAPIEPLPVPAGSIVEIRGKSFGTANGALEFNSAPFSYQLWTDTLIAVRLPDPWGYPTPSYFTVRRPDGAAFSGMAFVQGALPKADLPRITGISGPAGTPIAAAFPGEIVTLSGEHLGTMGLVLFKAGPGSAEVIAWSETAVQARVPFCWWEERTGSVLLFSGRPGGPGLLTGLSAEWPAFTIRAQPPEPVTPLAEPAPGSRVRSREARP